MGVSDYRNVKAWQLTDRFVIEVYKVIKNYPKEELYGLTSQLCRAAVPSIENIAEGTSRKHQKRLFTFSIYYSWLTYCSSRCYLNMEYIP